MHPETRQVAEHMREFGLNVMGRAIYDATFADLGFDHALSVTHAVHAAEILLKARIAQEHPLLIFSSLPAPSTTERELTISELVEHGRSYCYQDLPNLLWATTGHRIERLDDYREFGQLRNQIIHFAVPDNKALAAKTLRFAVEVVDPLLELFWNTSAIPYASNWDPIIYEGYLEERLIRIGVEINPRIRRILGPDSERYARELMNSNS